MLALKILIILKPDLNNYRFIFKTINTYEAEENKYLKWRHEKEKIRKLRTV